MASRIGISMVPEVPCCFCCAGSRSGNASGSANAISTDSTTSALLQPMPPIISCAAGTMANWPSPPTAPAMPSAQLRRSSATSRLSAP
ncbi:hypothetical protein D3C80_1363200 [compost metagenome]